MPLVLSGDGAVGPLSATEVSYLDGVTSAVQTQIDGKYTTGGAWSAWTPTITAESGTFTSVTVDTARYLQIGKLVIFNIQLTIGNAGTAASGLRFTLPVTAANSYGPVGIGREAGVSGAAFYIAPYSTTVAQIRKYDNLTIIATNASPVAMGIYEAA